MIFSPFYLTISWWKLPKCFVSINNSVCLLLYIRISQWKINIQHYMLAHPVSQHLNWHIQMSNMCNKYPTFNVRFPLKKNASQWENLQRILSKFTLAPFLFLKNFGSWYTDGSYSQICYLFYCSIQQYHDESFQNSMLEFTLLYLYFRIIIFINEG